MEQYPDMLPQEQQEQYQEFYQEQQPTPTNPKGKFSFVWGIVSCTVSLVLYILSIISISVIPFWNMHVTSYVCLALGLGFLILSIFTLIAGIKGIHTNPRTKAIIGTAFSGQNILIFFIIIIISIISICTHSAYDNGMPFGNCKYEHFNDYDDIYDDLYNNDDY